MITIAQTLEYQDHAAIGKVAAPQRPLSFIPQAMLAGAYIGVGVVLMVSASGPLMVAGSPWVKLVNGLVFGVALTLVIVAGGDLLTSSMMTLTQGWARRVITGRQWATTLLATFFANLAGAWVFAFFVHLGGLSKLETSAGTMLSSMLQAKAHEGSMELFARGVLCNVLVCVAVWSAARLTSEVAKLVVVFWCLLAFITSGFEHVVANMTTFGLGLMGGLPGASWDQFGRNMLMVGLGNLVGGALVGLAYVAGERRKVAEAAIGAEAVEVAAEAAN